MTKYLLILLCLKIYFPIESSFANSKIHCQNLKNYSECIGVAKKLAAAARFRESASYLIPLCENSKPIACRMLGKSFEDRSTKVGNEWKYFNSKDLKNRTSFTLRLVI